MPGLTGWAGTVYLGEPRPGEPSSSPPAPARSAAPRAGPRAMGARASSGIAGSPGQVRLRDAGTRLRRLRELQDRRPRGCSRQPVPMAHRRLFPTTSPATLPGRDPQSLARHASVLCGMIEATTAWIRRRPVPGSGRWSVPATMKTWWSTTTCSMPDDSHHRRLDPPGASSAGARDIPRGLPARPDVLPPDARAANFSQSAGAHRARKPENRPMLDCDASVAARHASVHMSEPSR